MGVVPPSLVLVPRWYSRYGRSRIVVRSGALWPPPPVAISSSSSEKKRHGGRRLHGRARRTTRGSRAAVLDATLRADPSVVYAAVATNGLALQFAEQRLQENEAWCWPRCPAGDRSSSRIPVRTDRDVVIRPCATTRSRCSTRTTPPCRLRGGAHGSAGMDLHSSLRPRCLRSERLIVTTAVADNEDNCSTPHQCSGPIERRCS